MRGKMPAKKTTKKTSVAKKAATKASAVAKPVVKKAVESKSSAVVPTMAMPKQVMPKLESKKLFKPLVALLLLALVYLLKDEVIVASVNGQPVTRFALIRTLEQQSASTALENMTLKLLVEQELKKAGVKVSDEEMDAEIAKIEEQLATQGQNLDDLLEAQGLKRAEVKEQLALSKGLEKLLADKVSVSDEEIQAYFDENKEMMGDDVVFEDVKEDIRTQLQQEKLVAEQQKWFAEIKKSAKINYYKFTPSSNL